MCLNVLNKWWNVLHRKTGSQGIRIALMPNESHISLAFLSDTQFSVDIRYLLQSRMKSTIETSIPSGSVYIKGASISADKGSPVYVFMSGLLGAFSISDTLISSLQIIRQTKGIFRFDLSSCSIDSLILSGLADLNYLRLEKVIFPSEESAIKFANSAPKADAGIAKLFYLTDGDITNIGEIIEPILTAKGWAVETRV